jgi:chemotaxis protein methyltransferase CheR
MKSHRLPSGELSYYRDLGLPDTGLSLLRDHVAERAGVFFEDGKQDLLADKLADLVTGLGLSSFLDYYYLLKYDDPARLHWSALLDRLAVPETYFWRQPEQFGALANVIVPEYRRQNGNAPLRIWSAACCSGEEPLSIAMALNEVGAFKHGPIEIVASDASRSLIDRARSGLYGERSFRNLSDDLRSRYFTRTSNGWRIDPELHSRVQWQTANLVDPVQVTPLARANVIFCRNVFIYFSDQTIRRIVRTFAQAMPAASYMFVGAAESLVRLSTDLALEEIGSAFVYVKKTGSEANTASAGALDSWPN